jgi:hypothetical protein
MAHHRNAVRLRSDGLAQLLDHPFGLPAREHEIDLGAGIGLRLPGAVVDDRAEPVPFRPAHKEADMHVAAPVVAQGLCLDARRSQQDQARRSECRLDFHGFLPLRMSPQPRLAAALT